MSALKTFVVSLVALGSVIAMAVLPSEAVAVPFKTIHAFCKLQSCKDGNGPGNLAADGAGNLFGITQGGGGSGGRGTIFELINGRHLLGRSSSTSTAISMASHRSAARIMKALSSN